MKLSQVIENILINHPTARSNDRILLLEIFAWYGLKLTPKQEEMFLDMPSTESVRRIRQKLQEQGKYLATDLVSKRRMFKSLSVQQSMPSIKPENIDELLSRPVSINPKELPQTSFL